MVDVSFFNNGVYFLSFQTNRGTIIKRIIKN
ncbi:T9SS type A sorting domain-containing protein [Bizionia paragorgiae]